MSGYGNKRKGNNWNKFQSSMPKMPSMPALGSQMISGGMGAKGQVSLGSGYSKAKRFGSQPDLTAFLKKYNIDMTVARPICQSRRICLNFKQHYGMDTEVH